jgi:hypothetical protein
MKLPQLNDKAIYVDICGIGLNITNLLSLRTYFLKNEPI